MNSIICNNLNEIEKVIKIFGKEGRLFDDEREVIDLFEKDKVVVLDDWFLSKGVGWCDLPWYILHSENRATNRGLRSAELFIKENEQQN